MFTPGAAITTVSDGSGTPVASIAIGSYNQGPGQFLTLKLKWEGTDTAPTSVTDVAGNTYVALPQGNDSTNHQNIQIYYVLTTKASAVNVITAQWASAVVTFPTIAAQRFSYQGTPAFLAQPPVATGASANPLSAAFRAGQLATMATTNFGGFTSTPTAPWLETDDTGATTGASMNYRVDAPGGTITAAETLSGGTSQWVVVAASFVDITTGIKLAVPRRLPTDPGGGPSVALFRGDTSVQVVAPSNPMDGLSVAAATLSANGAIAGQLNGMANATCVALGSLTITYAAAGIINAASILAGGAFAAEPAIGTSVAASVAFADGRVTYAAAGISAPSAVLTGDERVSGALAGISNPASIVAADGTVQQPGAMAGISNPSSVAFAAATAALEAAGRVNAASVALAGATASGQLDGLSVAASVSYGDLQLLAAGAIQGLSSSTSVAFADMSITQGTAPPPTGGGLLPGKVTDSGLGKGMGPYKRPGQVFGEQDPISPRLTSLLESNQTPPAAVLRSNAPSHEDASPATAVPILSLDLIVALLLLSSSDRDSP